jgi:hypothetical protein
VSHFFLLALFLRPIVQNSSVGDKDITWVGTVHERANTEIGEGEGGKGKNFLQ